MILHKNNNFKKGFTLIEILIVMAIISFMATAIVASVQNSKAKARDAKRMKDLVDLRIALNYWNNASSTFMETGSGCGSLGNGSGWVAYDYDVAGPYKSISQCLVDKDYLNQNVVDPTGRTWMRSIAGGGTEDYSYLKSTCTTGSYPGTYLFAKLETLSHNGSVNGPTNETCNTGYDTTYGINYVLKVD